MATDDSPKPDDVPPGMPSWVKYLLVVLLAVVLIALLAMFALGGDHGPGRHIGGMRSAPIGEEIDHGTGL
ncbi:hypothetical protein ACFVJS_10480 [Nocardioides sp. NPDC057772]|uniref:hypothetical protein n=1 Tax=unclassified Nocardioides TaxID=2615069 RepID=UPI0002028E04|nr:hypothetical protein [Nocardioides sp. NBC_00368]EGD42865.1 hypothetical protein NBCG_03000 [Nocardioidaceae bacterium Broad-1]